MAIPAEELVQIVLLTLEVTLGATLLGAVIGIPVGLNDDRARAELSDARVAHFRPSCGGASLCANCSASTQQAASFQPGLGWL